MASNAVGSCPGMPADLPIQNAGENQISQDLYKKGLKRKISETSSSVLVCNICQISLNSASQAEQHFQGRSHMAKVRSSQGENSTELMTSVIGPAVPRSTSTAAAAFTPLSVSQQPDQTLMTPVLSTATTEGLYNLYCKTCGKSFNSQSQAQQHYVGRQHKSKLQQKPEMAPVDLLPQATVVPSIATPTTYGETQLLGGSVMSMSDVKLGSNIKSKLFRCEACSITLNSEAQFEQHNRGLRHKITTGQVAAPPPPENEGWQGVRSRKFAKVMNTVDTPTGSVTMPSATPGGTRLGQFYCEMCDISVNSQIQLQQHLSGDKHKMRVNGEVPVPVPSRGRGRGRGPALGRPRGGFQGRRGRGAPPGRGNSVAYRFPRPPPLYRSFIPGGNTMP